MCSSALAPTTLIAVSRQTETPDFSVYRGADQLLELTDGLLAAARNARAIHTSAFGLSRDPCRSTILFIIEQVQDAGKIISFDPNYHSGIWSDLDTFLSVLRDVTGAGDAFWSGVLAGLIQRRSPLDSPRLGQGLAEYKIGILGPTREDLN